MATITNRILVRNENVHIQEISPNVEIFIPITSGTSLKEMNSIWENIISFK